MSSPGPGSETVPAKPWLSFPFASSPIFPAASDSFRIPPEKPDTTITAQLMRFQNGLVILEGNVRAVRETDLLTCGRALLKNNPRWMLASITPRLYRKESVLEKKAVREMTLDARNILWKDGTGEINASDSVNTKVEERTWDLATYSWVIISANAMDGHRDSNVLNFHGSVKIKDKDHFGQGDHLRYDKASTTATLTGNAVVEMEKWSEKEKKMVKHILTGEKITYNTTTKEAASE